MELQRSGWSHKTVAGGSLSSRARWPEAALDPGLAAPETGTFSGVRKPLPGRREPCVLSWNPGCAEHWTHGASLGAGSVRTGRAARAGEGHLEGPAETGKLQPHCVSAGLNQSQALGWADSVRGGGARGQGSSSSSAHVPVGQALSDGDPSPPSQAGGLSPNSGPASLTFGHASQAQAAPSWTTGSVQALRNQPLPRALSTCRALNCSLLWGRA